MPPPPREMTYLESDDEIRAAIQAAQAKRAQKPAAGAQPVSAAAAQRLDAEVRPERPQERPPMAVLCIVDDGRADGELLRIRGDRCTIGRTEGEVVIPHDSMMSGRHAEITRQKTAEGYRWLLKDLGSTNGSFVRVSGSILNSPAEFLVGRGRYRVEAAAPSAEKANQPAPAQTVAFAGDSGGLVLPSLVEITPSGPGNRLVLASAEYWIGQDAKQCQIVRADDATVNARHARLHRDNSGKWHVENNKSVNGLWLRVDQINLPMNCQFRLGEQRFLFRVLG